MVRGGEGGVKDENNHQLLPFKSYRILQARYIVFLGHILIILGLTLEKILISSEIIVYSQKSSDMINTYIISYNTEYIQTNI